MKQQQQQQLSSDFVPHITVVWQVYQKGKNCSKHAKSHMSFLDTLPHL